MEGALDRPPLARQRWRNQQEILGNAVLDVPEILACDQTQNVIRIPSQTDVPLTPRVRRLLDTAPFQRLAHISQLGFVSLVYPGATHSRFEHSLGAYRNSLLVLRQLGRDPRFREATTRRWGETVIVAALLHDIGHWPYCHPIEDMRLPQVPRHEVNARRYIADSEISDCLDRDWQTDSDSVLKLLEGGGPSPNERLAASILSGPIDIDKLDYLVRDSLHCGVPYGNNFDSGRLIGSLTLNADGSKIAITTKGRTAAELMVFARYVMFSEVYWHHAVRSATAMLQRAFFELQEVIGFEAVQTSSDQNFSELIFAASQGHPARRLIQGLFGSHRQIYKRWGQFSFFDSPDLYRRIARRPYAWTVQLAQRIAEVLSSLGLAPVDPLMVLVDAPPQGVEVQFRVDVRELKTDTYRSLGEISPVVRALAEHQFDDFVKQVRVLVAPDILTKVSGSGLSCNEVLEKALEQMPV